MTVVSEDFSILGVLTAFALQLAIALGCIAGFSILRPVNKIIYQPKLKFAEKDDGSKRPPALKSYPTAWIKPIAYEDTTKNFDKLGFDSVIFLKFVKFWIPYMGINANFERIVGQQVDTGTNFTGTEIDNSNLTVIFDSSLNVLSINQIDVSSPCYSMFRKLYFESPIYQKSIVNRTVLITDLPERLRSDEALLHFMTSRPELGLVQPSHAIINRNLPNLSKLIEEHEKTTKKLELILSKYLANPDKLPAKRPIIDIGSDPIGGMTGKVDAIAFLGSRLNNLEEQIYSIRAQPQSMHTINSSGFVSYDNVVHANEAAQSFDVVNVVNFNKKGWKNLESMTVKLSPDFDDIIWENVGIIASERYTRRLFAAGLTVGISVSWVLLAGLITSLSNLSNVFSGDAAVVAWLAANPKAKAFLQSYLVPVLTAILNFLLPIALRHTTVLQGAKSRAGVERSVIYKLFLFYMVQIFLFAAVSALWTAFKQPVTAGDSITDEFKFKITGAITGLANNSNFYIALLATYYSGYGIEIIQGVPLVMKFIRRKFTTFTPREEFEARKPPNFDFTRYVYEIRNESHGKHFLKVFNLVVFATGFYQFLTFIVIYAANKSGANSNAKLLQWMIVVPLPFLTIAFWIVFKVWVLPRAIYCTSTLSANNLIYGSRRLTNNEDAAAGADLEDRVMNPALAKPLMKVWVPRKSTHLLSSLYSPKYANIEDYELQHPEIQNSTVAKNRSAWLKGLPSLHTKKKELSKLKAAKEQGEFKTNAHPLHPVEDDEENSNVTGEEGISLHALTGTTGGGALVAGGISRYGTEKEQASVAALGDQEDLLPPEEIEALRLQIREEERTAQSAADASPAPPAHNRYPGNRVRGASRH
ncbi:hypothetical protein HK100_007045 [Physocladia obscura]|uniref:DUF221-domain-containing protein n=1 Tax=Physocladia obscura TaxID=109957 RepID=A0AAD5XMK8_9FUNG|nr:hypothetical protein HK100_007045 [Physocladia obscura]